MSYAAPIISADDEVRIHLAIGATSPSIASSTSSSSSYRRPTVRASPAFSKVLENGSLYLSNLRSVQDEHLLYKLHVTHILSIVSDSTPVRIPGNREHRRITLSDLPSEDLLAILPTATALIDEALRNHGVVMVHCQHGVSRSASVVIGFLMMKRRWSLAHTLSFVKQRRVCVQPNAGFLRQLQAWEEELFGPVPASML